MNKGLVFDFHRGTTHDGPGMRTTVFFKGCPLHCHWCHNPESICLEKELRWDEKKCIGCMTCLAVCPVGWITAGRTAVKCDLCRETGAPGCVKNCPNRALVYVEVGGDTE